MAKKQFCLRGHDTHIVGRQVNTGNCKACNNEWHKIRNEKRKAAKLSALEVAVFNKA